MPPAQPFHAFDPIHHLLGVSPISRKLDHALQFGGHGTTPTTGLFALGLAGKLGKLGRDRIGVVIRTTPHEHEGGVGLDADRAADGAVLGVAFAVEQGQDEIRPGRPGLEERPDGIVVRRQGVAVLAPLGVEQNGRVVAGVEVVAGWEGGELPIVPSGQAQIGRGRGGIPVVEVALPPGREDVVRRGGLLRLLLGVLVVVRRGGC
mmetsp:Transcript_6936/g.19502  ORF Transcript_6936/g.19502 Transcript_6936/m.19502 type:complete len:205 (-) Transcript_6936:212-826(-)